MSVGSPEKENTVSRIGIGLAQWAMGLVVAMLLLVGASAVHAETENTGAGAESSSSEEKQGDGFVLELGAGFLLHSQGQNASVIASIENPPGPAAVPTPFEGRVEPALAPGFTVEAAVLSPPLFSHEYAPSVFFHVGYENVLEDSFATFRAIDSFSPSDIPNQVQQKCEDGVFDSACDIRSSIDTSIDSMWYLGVGFQVPTPIFEDRLKLRVALDYLGQKWGDTSFSWERNTQYPTPPPPANQPPPPKSQKVDAIFSGVTTHALGFGTSALVDVYQWRSLQMRLFLDLRFAWILNDMEDEYNVESPGVGSFQVFVGPEKFIAQAGGGIRIYWSPNW